MQEIISTVIDSFEQSAFVFVEYIEENHPDITEEMSWRVSFEGASRGKLSLGLCPELASEVTANILGFEQSQITEEMVIDALGEVLNMIVGRFLSSFYGTKPVFDIGVPEFGPLPTSYSKEYVFACNQDLIVVGLELDTTPSVSD